MLAILPMAPYIAREIKSAKSIKVLTIKDFQKLSYPFPNYREVGNRCLQRFHCKGADPLQLKARATEQVLVFDYPVSLSVEHQWAEQIPLNHAVYKKSSS